MDEKILRAIHLLNAIIPEVDELLSDMEKSGGWLNLGSEFIKIINTFGFRWWEYYEDEKLLRAIGSLMFFDADELREIREDGKINEILDEFADALNSDEIVIKIPTKEEQEEWARKLETAEEEEQKNILKQIAKLYTGFLCTLFNYLSLMVHGRSMCQLVASAKNGNDEAFCVAVQIDRTVLNLPYFRERIIRSQFTNDQYFLSRLGRRIQNPIIKSRIRYRTLWLTFAILDDEKLLELPHEDILDICEKVGVYGAKFGIEDVGHLRKRLSEYRKMHRTSIIF